MKKRPPRKFSDRIKRGPKFCRLCREKIVIIDYKNVDLLQKFVTERGKIIPNRISGNCATHQRKLTRAVKRARIAALLPFVAE